MSISDVVDDVRETSLSITFPPSGAGRTASVTVARGEYSLQSGANTNAISILRYDGTAGPGGALNMI